MQTTKNFYRHSDTGEIYAVEVRWNGEVVGSCGPLAENDLKDLNSYEYTSDKNEWLQEVNAKLLLME